MQIKCKIHKLIETIFYYKTKTKLLLNIEYKVLFRKYYSRLNYSEFMNNKADFG